MVSLLHDRMSTVVLEELLPQPQQQATVASTRTNGL